MIDVFIHSAVTPDLLSVHPLILENMPHSVHTFGISKTVFSVETGVRSEGDVA